MTKKEIKDRAIACGNFASKKLCVQQGKFPDVEDIVMKFFVQFHELSIPVSGPMLMEKAREIALKLNIKDACFSTRLPHKFKMRHRISSQVISRESKAASAEKIDE